MIAPKDFSLPGGELTPTMKLKRHTVMEMYEKKIQQVIVVTKREVDDRELGKISRSSSYRCTSMKRRAQCGDQPRHLRPQRK